MANVAPEDPKTPCAICGGDGWVEIGDRINGWTGVLEAAAVDCVCQGGDPEDMPKRHRDVIAGMWV